jgi:hypothetical protein
MSKNQLNKEITEAYLRAVAHFYDFYFSLVFDKHLLLFLSY